MIALVEMPLARRLVPLALALLITVAVFEMIRRRRLREEFATMWLSGAIILMALAIFPDILFWLQDIFQTNFLTLVMLIGFGMVSLILLHLTMISSEQASKIRRLAQRLALQSQQLELLKAGPRADVDKSAEPPAGTGDESADEAGVGPGSQPSESG